jgi:excisionase family DNA binding protein
MPKITKDEAARILGKTTRAVERYAAASRLSVTYEKGTTRDVPVYDRAEVEQLAEELKKPHTPVRGSIATRGDNADNRVSEGVGIPASQALERFGSGEGRAILASIIADALQGAQRPVKAISSTVDLAQKLTLTLPEAAALSGLSANHLREAIKAGKLKAKIIGRGYKLRPDDLRAYVSKVMK